MMFDHMPDFTRLGLDFMDRDHEEFHGLMGRLLDLTGDGSGETQAVTEILETVLEHTRDHFGREETAMKEAGFPPYAIHRGEHERVLERLEEILGQWRANPDRRHLADIVSGELLPWFHQHLRTMDAATAAFLLQVQSLGVSLGSQRHGG